MAQYKWLYSFEREDRLYKTLLSYFVKFGEGGFVTRTHYMYNLSSLSSEALLIQSLIDQWHEPKKKKMYDFRGERFLVSETTTVSVSKT
jgi:hypothetical protein